METTKTAFYKPRVQETLPLRVLLFPNPVFNTGLALVAASAGLFALAEIKQIGMTNDAREAMFVLHYLLMLTYGVVLLATVRTRREEPYARYDHVMLLCVLGYISAFALNRVLPVFEQSVDWLCAGVILQCTALVLVSYRKLLANWLLHGVYAFLGFGALLSVYFAVYLLPLYAFGVIGLVALGLGMHTFVPAFTLYRIVRHVRSVFPTSPALVTPFILGIGLPLVFVSIFVGRWHNLKETVTFATNQSIVDDSTLPQWVRVSQRLPQGWVAERLVKTDLKYSVPEPGRWNFGRMPSTRFEETLVHDPLVNIAVLCSGKLEVSESDRIKILESLFDARHKSEVRLWQGTDLSTHSVVTNVRIFPEHRIAYTEKTLTIKNSTSQTWNNSQEALYSLYLPEGGVVTSLSLWVNGKEEKGYLTSKAKADSAYTTIVGVESRVTARDPSVVHWLEGNRVSVRVFPCNPNENRIVKIGVTAPLRKDNDKLVYENIYFDGPAPPDDAPETIKLAFEKTPDDLQLPFALSDEGNDVYTLNRRYEPYWEVTFTAPPLSTNPFVFNNTAYNVAEHVKSYDAFTPDGVFLDLNAEWTRSELDAAWQAVKGQKVYTAFDERNALSENQLDAVFKKSRSFNYTLFPFQQLRGFDNALVVTKSGRRSANLSDIKDSQFYRDLTEYVRKPRGIKVFNIGTETSPYLKSLKELRVFDYDQGNVEKLSSLIAEKQFVKTVENDERVVVDRAAMELTRTKNYHQAGFAPDHLMRLFTYNDVMRRLGSGLLLDESGSDEAVCLATEAYVVTPVSSLVVLETQKDYERFNIEESKNSLKNASTKSSGAVPEPHEWMLMIALALFVLYFVFISVKR